MKKTEREIVYIIIYPKNFRLQSKTVTQGRFFTMLHEPDSHFVTFYTLHIPYTLYIAITDNTQKQHLSLREKS